MNHFARLGIEARPWVDADLLKQKFLELSAAAHPDKAEANAKTSSEQEFQQLNESHRVLQDTRTRLLHLLEECGVPKQEHVQDVPPVAMELFPAVASTTKRADELIKDKAAESSPMLKVQFMERALDEIERIQQLQSALGEKIARVEDRVREVDNSWTGKPDAATLKVLREAVVTLGFLERWKAQLQEKVGNLTF